MTFFYQKVLHGELEKNFLFVKGADWHVQLLKWKHESDFYFISHMLESFKATRYTLEMQCTLMTSSWLKVVKKVHVLGFFLQKYNLIKIGSQKLLILKNDTFFC